MHRLRESGPVAKPLVDDLEEMVLLFQGLHDVVMHELGFPRSQGHYHHEAAECAARQWLASVGEDEDMSVDNRMMVPVCEDDSGLYKVWCNVGFRAETLQCKFLRALECVGRVDGQPGGAAKIKAVGTTFTAFRPVFFEAHTTKLLNREEFRELCDRVSVKLLWRCTEHPPSNAAGQTI
eukprot:m51a1_g7984 hypothetical protein (179) ;mRNA; r:73124-73840